MTTPLLLIIVAVFLCVSALVVGVALAFGGKSTSSLEDRLDVLTAARSPGRKSSEQEGPALLASSLDESVSFAESLFSRFGSLRQLLEQADVRLHPTHFLLLSLGVAGLTVVPCLMMRLPIWVPAITAPIGVALPFIVVVFKRKRRMAAFARQLPDALELVIRALRAGHSLAAGFNLVGDEMPEPISIEFSRCYEEQNLGVALEESLQGMTNRVPNLDLRFFATAVMLQRQTGGDLAEILDKIGHLVRERFTIWGQIQALTGEGRLSGIVLLALPPVLFVVMYNLNPDYCMLLFNDPIGQWMLAGAVLMQLAGAMVIRKIINIKV